MWVDYLQAQADRGKEVFSFASFVHLAFVNIHPFSDGNGRIARLLEKWFLAEKLDYDKAFPFLLMLPQALIFEK